MGKEYKTIDFGYWASIKDAVIILWKYKKAGELVCGDFNGHTLYSDTVTMDGAYQQITGKTKAELDKAEQEWRENFDRKEREHKATIPELSREWMIKGREVLTEDRWEFWDKIVPIRLNDLYHGMELGCCLDIVEILNNGGTLDEAKQMIESQGHSGMSYSLVCAMVKEFCDRGQEFAKYVQ